MNSVKKKKPKTLNCGDRKHAAKSRVCQWCSRKRFNVTKLQSGISPWNIQIIERVSCVRLESGGPSLFRESEVRGIFSSPGYFGEIPDRGLVAVKTFKSCYFYCSVLSYGGAFGYTVISRLRARKPSNLSDSLQENIVHHNPVLWQKIITNLVVPVSRD